MKTLLYRVPKSQLSSKTGGWLKNVLWTEVWCVCTVKYQYQVYTMKHTNIQRWCIKRYGYIICSFYKIYKIFFFINYKKLKNVCTRYRMCVCVYTATSSISFLVRILWIFNTFLNAQFTQQFRFRFPICFFSLLCRHVYCGCLGIFF